MKLPGIWYGALQMLDVGKE